MKSIITKVITVTLIPIVTVMLFAVGGTLYKGYKLNQYIEQKQQERLKEMHSNIPKYYIAPHVVKLTVTVGDQVLGYGTGSYMEFSGKVRLVTNKHICEPYPEMKTEVRIGSKLMKILHVSKTTDLCILKSDRNYGLQIASKDVTVLDRVILVGHPRGLPITVREGYVMEESAKPFPWVGEHAMRYQMVSTIAYGGNSGSPVTNLQGEVIGVLFGGFRDSITEALIVPRSVLIKYLLSTYTY